MNVTETNLRPGELHVHSAVPGSICRTNTLPWCTQGKQNVLWVSFNLGEEQATQLAASTITVWTPPSASTMSDIGQKAAAINADMIVIDHIQMLSDYDVSTSYQEAKRLALTADIPVVVFRQAGLREWNEADQNGGLYNINLFPQSSLYFADVATTTYLSREESAGDLMFSWVKIRDSALPSTVTVKSLHR